MTALAKGGHQVAGQPILAPLGGWRRQVKDRLARPMEILQGFDSQIPGQGRDARRAEGLATGGGARHGNERLARGQIVACQTLPDIPTAQYPHGPDLTEENPLGE